MNVSITPYITGLEISRAPRKIWLTTVMAGREENPFAFDLIESARSKLVTQPDACYQRYALAATPDDADIILFIETNHYKQRDHVFKLLGNELIRRYPEKCFAFDFQPEPPALLPGVYVSLPKRRQNNRRFRPGGYLGMYNEVPLNIWHIAQSTEPRYLFSFRGSVHPHPIRGALQRSGFSGEDCNLTWTEKWFDYDQAEKERYAEEICHSKFVLCPRGVATSSYRLYETMALGRVPVILADDWEAPQGPDWDEFSIGIRESQIPDIPGLLRRREPEWREMGMRGREVWERMFHPDIALYRTLETIEALVQERNADSALDQELTIHEEWKSLRFAWQRGWTLPQQMHRSYRLKGTRERIYQKLMRLRVRGIGISDH